MTNLKSIAFTISVAFVAIFLPAAVGSPYIISDDRVRSLDVTPVLGRGYSIMTNSFQSTCLQVENTTVPSYNYDYSFFDFTQSTSLEVDMSSKVSHSFGWGYIRGRISAQSSSNTKTQTNTQYVVSSMRIERYYSSLREEHSPLNEGASELLNRKDYISFFKACGPNYVRGIRRAQEVMAVFSFESSSTERSKQYASSIQVSVGWWYGVNRRYESNSQSNSMERTLQITIKGYGLGLSEEGSETLVARDLEGYHDVMKFAFKTMTRIPNAHEIGMVYGIEVVPWVENVMFQVAAGISDEGIEIPQPRSLIPRAYRISNPTDIDFIEEQRGSFRCKQPAYEIDRHGYCCELDVLYNFVEEEYEADDSNLSNLSCRPLRVLDRNIVRDNMVNNGEFIARMDRAIRYKSNSLNTLEKCISAARAFPVKYDFHVLKSMDNVKYDATIDTQFSLFELKLALDPFNDYSMVKHMARELDEFIDMFYQPCLAALFGSNIGRTSDTDASYFTAYPWHTHDECIKLSCFGSGMRWDRREGGGCVPGMIAGAASLGYSWDDSSCSKKVDSGADVEECKYDSEELHTFHLKMTSCWSGSVPVGRIDYFMDHFCMPDITAKVLEDEEIDELKVSYENSCHTWTLSNSPSVNPTDRPSLNPSVSINPSSAPSSVPSESAKPSMNPSTVPSAVPSDTPSTSAVPTEA